MHKVMIHPAEYDDCLNAVERAFELFPLAIEGKKVIVKLSVSKAILDSDIYISHPKVNGPPVVDPDKCITCYCCQEICHERAIQLL